MSTYAFLPRKLPQGWSSAGLAVDFKETGHRVHAVEDAQWQGDLDHNGPERETIERLLNLAHQVWAGPIGIKNPHLSQTKGEGKGHNHLNDLQKLLMISELLHRKILGKSVHCMYQ